jgi:AraC family transcriptional regulator of arabinose operon
MKPLVTQNLHDKRIKEGFIGQKMITLTPNIKKSILGNNLINKLFITAIGFYPNAAHHDRERKEGSNEYILLYCLKWQGTISIENRSINLLPNTFFIILKNVAHHYKSALSDPWSIIWVHFTGESADLLYNRYLDSFGNKESFIAYSESRVYLFNEIQALMERSFQMREIEIANIKFFDFISSLIYSKDINPYISEDDAISISIEFMKNHLENIFSVEELARKHQVSTSHYSRLFHQKTGSSPIQYFNQLKIHKSCQYLYFTDKNIKEICTELGFNDQYYFSRLFKKLMGISPAKYRSKEKK